LLASAWIRLASTAKPSPPNETRRDACPNDAFKHAAKNIAFTETLIAGAGKRRVIRDSVLYAELAEPPIGEVHLHFTTDQPL
jgi:hypothetical protein